MAIEESVSLLESWINTWFAELYRAAYMILRDRTDAEDCVQTVFLRAHAKAENFAQIENPRAWLHRITSNCALNMIRQRKHHRPYQEMIEMPVPDDADERWIRRRVVADAIAELPDDVRGIVVLYYFEDLSGAQIAEALGLAAGTVKSRLHRARAHLRRRLGDL